MIDNKLGQHLHDQATSGKPLTQEEQQQLDAWYKQMDAEEEAILARPDLQPTIAEVQDQIDKTLAAIISTARKIHAIKRHTAVLQRGNEVLEIMLSESRNKPK